LSTLLAHKDEILRNPPSWPPPRHPRMDRRSTGSCPETLEPYRDCPERKSRIVRECVARGSFDRVV
jgi:hypothetical protein